MSTFDRALCIGKHVLFDSTDPADHHLAAEFCVICPLTAACRRHVANVRATAGVYGQPEGTWAGELILEPSRDTVRRLACSEKAEQRARQDASYSVDEARRAHTAYTGGDRSEWARIGHLVYDRRRKRGGRSLDRWAS